TNTLGVCWFCNERKYHLPIVLPPILPETPLPPQNLADLDHRLFSYPGILAARPPRATPIAAEVRISNDTIEEEDKQLIQNQQQIQPKATLTSEQLSTASHFTARETILSELSTVKPAYLLNSNEKGGVGSQNIVGGRVKEFIDGSGGLVYTGDKGVPYRTESEYLPLPIIAPFQNKYLYGTEQGNSSETVNDNEEKEQENGKDKQLDKDKDNNKEPEKEKQQQNTQKKIEKGSGYVELKPTQFTTIFYSQGSLGRLSRRPQGAGPNKQYQMAAEIAEDIRRKEVEQTKPYIESVSMLDEDVRRQYAGASRLTTDAPALQLRIKDEENQKQTGDEQQAFPPLLPVVCN
ncbi:MAG: hypothetical protein EZS28_047206, partial [Streblomastix strix]